MSLLEGIGLRRAFDGLVAVANVTFHLKAGEMLALIGPNGAGKSTLFNLLSGQLALDAGKVMFNGLNITGATPTQIARLGIGRIFQTASVFGSMTVRENVQVAAIAGNGKTFRFNHPASAYYRESVDVLLVQLGLAQMADRGAGELAYGDTKRLELALALINQPKLLLMDEPTAGMGLAERAEVMALIRSIAQARGMAILFTEHDMAAVFATADRVLVLDRGVVIAEGPPAAIRANRRVQAVYLGEDG
jgi:branched-chain amino acid transport system ATP-binding protein